MVTHFSRIKMGQNLKLTDPGNLLEVKGDRDMSLFVFFFFFIQRSMERHKKRC